MDPTKSKAVSSYFQSDVSSVFDQIPKSHEANEAITQDIHIEPDVNMTKLSNTNPQNPNEPNFSHTVSDLNYSAVGLAENILQNEFDNCTSVNLNNSPERNRAYDAWIPSESTKEVLRGLASSPAAVHKVNKDLLVVPGIAVKEDFDDPVCNLMKRIGQKMESEPRSLTSLSVTQDDNGLRQLIAGGCYYAAVNLTTQLLSVYGQGERKPGQFCKHTAHSVQLWFTRIALLVKLRRFSMAEVECEAFKDLNSPDLYFEFYPELYGGRRGSMVPFSFRLLVAELPAYLGKHLSSLDRLSKLLATCDEILSNLNGGLLEDGSSLVESDCSSVGKDFNRDESIVLWRTRRTKVLYALVRCAVSLKDFRLAYSLIKRLLEDEDSESSGLFAALGRLCLYLGDINSAQEAFKRHLEHSPAGAEYDPVQGLIHSSFVAIARSEFVNAAEILKQALKISPNNTLVINNLSVCLMFNGKIREAIELVQTSLNSNPKQMLHESIVLNLCTMYELESSKSQSKKADLLALIANRKGDSFNTGALKLMV